MRNKLVILEHTIQAETHPLMECFVDEYINPLDYIDDRVHNVKVIYQDMFKDGNQELMLHILNETNKKSPLVFNVLKKINDSPHNIIGLNGTLMRDNDLKYIVEDNDISMIGILIKEKINEPITFTLVLPDGQHTFTTIENTNKAIVEYYIAISSTNGGADATSR